MQKQSARCSRMFVVTELAVSGTQCTLHSVRTDETTRQIKVSPGVWLDYCIRNGRLNI